MCELRLQARTRGLPLHPERGDVCLSGEFRGSRGQREGSARRGDNGVSVLRGLPLHLGPCRDFLGFAVRGGSAGAVCGI